MMETIYNWLLHNVGNEGNYFTILNVRQQTRAEGTPWIAIMARTSAFDVLNLLIEQTTSTSPEPSMQMDRPLKASYGLQNDEQVIAFLAEGNLAEPATSPESALIRVFVLEPVGNAGDITFPPALSEKEN